MGKLIDLAAYRRKKCLEALMLQIGLPGYCEECGDDIEALLLGDELDGTDIDLADLLEEVDAPLPTVVTPPARQRRAARARKK
jgi:hypothetical protein